MAETQIMTIDRVVKGLERLWELMQDQSRWDPDVTITTLITMVEDDN
jgi:hypothetical protein